MKMPASPNGSNGRQPNGRLAKGNAGGPGNPHGRHVAELRAMMLETVSDDDFRAVVARLVGLAKCGDLPAIRELLDRMMGRPRGAIDLHKEEIEVSELDAILEREVQRRVDRRQQTGNPNGGAVASSATREMVQ